MTAVLVLVGALFLVPLLGATGLLLICVLLVLVILFATVLLGPITAASLYLRSWWSEGYWCCFIPKDQYVDIFTKIIYLGFQAGLIGSGDARPTSSALELGKIRSRAFLEKRNINYALNLAVPLSKEDEFFGSDGSSDIQSSVAESLGLLPMFQHFQGFDFGEDPVEFVMHRLGSIFPAVHQKWPDKQSDAALARFCRVGVAAGR
jgi:hypothetical protein